MGLINILVFKGGNIALSLPGEAGLDRTYVPTAWVVHVTMGKPPWLLAYHGGENQNRISTRSWDANEICYGWI